MAKVHISTKLNSSENGITQYEGFGILDGNRLIFYEDNVKVVINLKESVLELERTTNEYTIFLSFENSLTKNGIYDIKCDSMQIPIEVITNILNIQDGDIYIDYNLVLGGVNQGNFVYDIKYEVSI